MFGRSLGRDLLGVSFVVLATVAAVPAHANPAVIVRVTNASTAFDLAYAASASTLGGYVTSDNAPMATIPRQTNDAYTITSASPKAIAGELIYRAAGDPTRECTFRYTLSYTGTKFVLTTDARASWTGQMRCAATTSGLDKTKGDFTVTLTVQ
ncbi:MAG TPA: hypothetical protein VGU66_09430 [Candidatus Elarobacter sp.]|nr:hypothetical protein [Candidatus Elarobacter sp.]